MAKPYYLRIKSKITQLYLMGVKGAIEHPPRPSYLFGKRLAIAAIFLAGFKYSYHKFQPEFYSIDQPSAFVPRFVYRWRYEQYKFWEHSRLSRAKKATFSYYEYDPVSDFVFFMSKEGHYTSKKYFLNIDDIQKGKNPLYESLVQRAHERDNPEIRSLGSVLSAYDEQKNNPFDLKNYLYSKNVSATDVARSCVSRFMVWFRLTNFYRFDHLFTRSDYVYEFEKLKLALNLSHRRPNMDRIEKYQKILDELPSLAEAVTNQ